MEEDETNDDDEAVDDDVDVDVDVDADDIEVIVALRMVVAPVVRTIVVVPSSLFMSPYSSSSDK